MADDFQAQDAAWGKQYDEQQATAKQQEETTKQPQTFLQKWAAPVGRVTTSMLDGAVAATEDAMFSNPSKDSALGAPERGARDVAAGAVTGATNIADAAGSAVSTLAPQLMGPEAGAYLAAASPIWEHAKQHILDFRDAIQVKDPTLADSVVQGVAQLAVPFAGYSRALSMLHGVTNMFAAGAITDATALAPHDMRMADLFALGKTTEGKLGDALRALAPDGSALNAYVNYLSDKSNEDEAHGRFKNVLDGFGVNLITTPLMAGAAQVLKQGTRGVRYAMDNGIRNTISDMVPAPKFGPAAQQGMVAFHGSPHDFDQFDSSAIGSGQGAQTYGHGLYFAENPDVAATYNPRFTNTSISRKDLVDYFKPGETRPMSNGTKDTITAYDPKTGVVTATRKEPNLSKSYEVSYRDTGADWVRVRQALGQPLQKNGKFYTADIGDEHVQKMADWDKPMTRQPMEFVAAMHNAGIPVSAGMDGEVAYRALSEKLGGAAKASEYLSKEGVPGIRYLDQGSRNSAGEGTRNIVLFDAKHAKIVKKE